MEDTRGHVESTFAWVVARFRESESFGYIGIDFIKFSLFDETSIQRFLSSMVH